MKMPKPYTLPDPDSPDAIVLHGWGANPKSDFPGISDSSADLLPTHCEAAVKTTWIPIKGDANAKDH